MPHKNREAKLAYLKEWRAKNAEIIKIGAAEYREKNRENLKAQKAEYRKMNRDRINAQARKYCAENKDKKRVKGAKWRAENRDRIRSRMNEYSKYRARTDPKYRLRKNISRQLGLALSAARIGKKNHSWEVLVGYSAEDLAKHLESQFKPGMSWDNYGMKGWVIDHIQPQALFSYESTEDEKFRECWALSNLQPLWASDNSRKLDRLPDGSFARHKKHAKQKG